ncbi:uncharacterized protein LOC144950356 [Lampetra fluviatilis]
MARLAIALHAIIVVAMSRTVATAAVHPVSPTPGPLTPSQGGSVTKCAPPRHVTISSRDFNHVLSWEPPEGGGADTTYRVQLLRNGQSWTEVARCGGQGVLRCPLELHHPAERYRARVQGGAPTGGGGPPTGGGAHCWGLSKFFRPLDDTQWSAPEVRVRVEVDEEVDDEEVEARVPRVVVALRAPGARPELYRGARWDLNVCQLLPPAGGTWKCHQQPDQPLVEELALRKVLAGAELCVEARLKLQFPRKWSDHSRRACLQIPPRATARWTGRHAANAWLVVGMVVLSVLLLALLLGAWALHYVTEAPGTLPRVLATLLEAEVRPGKRRPLHSDSRPLHPQHGGGDEREDERGGRRGGRRRRGGR